MSRGSMKFAVSTAVLAALAACEPEPAAEPPAPTPIEDLAPPSLEASTSRAKLTLEFLRPHSRDGRLSEDAAWGSRASNELAIGESTTLAVAIGGPDCGSTVAGDGATPVNFNDHGWAVTATRLDAPFGVLAFDVEWDRYRKRDSAESEVVSHGRRTVSLREGASQVIDFVGALGDEIGDCLPTTAVNLRASVVEDHSHADRLLAYDLWYEHTDGTGRATRRRVRSIAEHGEKVDLRLAPVRFDGEERDMVIRMTGELQARWRSDDALVVRLGARRFVSAPLAGERPSGGIGRSGFEVFTLHAGQTVRMEFPAMFGWAAGIKLAERFAGHSEALILTIHEPA